MLAQFEEIAAAIGMSIPAPLGRLIALGTERCLAGDVIPLSSIFDFEFIDAGDAERILFDWLGRAKQRGADFTLFPFGQSGAGDAYCFVELEDGDTGIALVMHDQEASKLEYPGVSNWVTDEYIKAFVNLDDLDGDPAEAVARMKKEIALVAPVLLPEHCELLEGLLSAYIVERSFTAGPRSPDKRVWSLISQDSAESLSQLLVSDDQVEFDVIPQWED